MNVLVTGGLGVNGSWVTKKLVERGHTPIVFENRADTSLLGDAAEEVEIVRGDVTDRAALEEAMRKHDVQRVVHMAALIQGFQQKQLEAFRVNALATVLLLEAARNVGVERVVFTSSRAVYGEVGGEFGHPTYRPIGEDHPFNPRLVYDVCKVASEGMGRNYAEAFGLQFIALRFAAIFGPGKTQRHGGFSVLSSLIEDPLAGRLVRVRRGGDQRDDVIYVDDAAEATVLATLHERPAYTEYNISRGIGTTLGDLADAVRRVVPGADIEIGPGLDYMGVGVNYYAIMDNARAREDLGFQPRFSLRSAVEHYAAAVRELRLVSEGSA